MLIISISELLNLNWYVFHTIIRASLTSLIATVVARSFVAAKTQAWCTAFARDDLSLGLDAILRRTSGG